MRKRDNLDFTWAARPRRKLLKQLWQKSSPCGGAAREAAVRAKSYAYFVSSAIDEHCFLYIIQRMLNYLSIDPASPPVNLIRLAEWLNVLAEPKRLLIFNLLMQGVQCNCELGETLQMAPNLISHHLSKLRAAGLVDVERDALDARWVYFSVNRLALDELNAALGAFLDPARIQPRHPACGPKRVFQ